MNFFEYFNKLHHKTEDEITPLEPESKENEYIEETPIEETPNEDKPTETVTEEPPTEPEKE